MRTAVVIAEKQTAKAVPKRINLAVRGKILEDDSEWEERYSPTLAFLEEPIEITMESK